MVLFGAIFSSEAHKSLASSLIINRIHFLPVVSVSCRYWGWHRWSFFLDYEVKDVIIIMFSNEVMRLIEIFQVFFGNEINFTNES